MKRIITIALVSLVGFMAAETTASAQLLKNLLKKATTETAAPAATTNGQAAGAALKALYSQYKADGKLDMANLTNIMNLATLANNVVNRYSDMIWDYERVHAERNILLQIILHLFGNILKRFRFQVFQIVSPSKYVHLFFDGFRFRSV